MDGETVAGRMRPRPPPELVDTLVAAFGFKPAPDLLEWVTATFIDPEGPLANPDHAHLAAASIGILWTGVANSRHGKRVIGQCEFKPPGGTMGKWARARAQAQIMEWFGTLPDFLLTFDAQYAAQCTDAQFCALVEHELYHCGQALDFEGLPKFSKEGIPVFALRGHDVEEFIGVVRRYGAVTEDVAALAEAAAAPPEIAAEQLLVTCGTCHA